MSLGVCRVCGCTEDDPCTFEGLSGQIVACCWAAPDLCSACAGDDVGDVEAPPLLYDAHGGVLVR